MRSPGLAGTRGLPLPAHRAATHIDRTGKPDNWHRLCRRLTITFGKAARSGHQISLFSAWHHPAGMQRFHDPDGRDEDMLDPAQGVCRIAPAPLLRRVRIGGNAPVSSWDGAAASLSEILTNVREPGAIRRLHSFQTAGKTLRSVGRRSDPSKEPSRWQRRPNSKRNSPNCGASSTSVPNRKQALLAPGRTGHCAAASRCYPNADRDDGLCRSRRGYWRGHAEHGRVFRACEHLWKRGGGCGGRRWQSRV